MVKVWEKYIDGPKDDPGVPAKKELKDLVKKNFLSHPHSAAKTAVDFARWLENIFGNKSDIRLFKHNK